MNSVPFVKSPGYGHDKHLEKKPRGFNIWMRAHCCQTILG